MKTIYKYIPSVDMEVEYVVGESAKDNFNIIDICHGDDIWFHVDGESSCHVIARIFQYDIDKKQMKQIVTQGALLCKQYSRYKSEKNLSIIYTYLKFIEKTKIAGSVLTQNTKRITI